MNLDPANVVIKYKIFLRLKSEFRKCVLALTISSTK